MRRGLVLCVLACAVPVSPTAAGISTDERVEARRAIEEVRWRHRIWPASNSRPKPSFEQSLPDAEIRRRVLDDLSKEKALEVHWSRVIKPREIQAELDRMARGSRNPEMLGEIFAALGNDPQRVATSLARPVLTDRLIRSFYARDRRFHGDLETRAREDLVRWASGEDPRSTSGVYRRTTFAIADGAAAEPAFGVVRLEPERWKVKRAECASIGKGGSTPLRENDDSFSAVTILTESETTFVTAELVWPKVPFDEWWSRASEALTPDPTEPAGPYILPVLRSAPCVTDTWVPTYYEPPDPLFDPVSVWTGTEIVVWGGFQDLGVGYRYDPATDTWTSTTRSGAPTGERLGTSAVWTGTEMIVWGGGSEGSNTGGRYDPELDRWLATSTGPGVPSARSAHSAVWTGNEMIVWGGAERFPEFGGGTYFASGARYDPSNDTWAPLAAAPPPLAPRALHSAVWTGTEMIVWGGRDDATAFQTGGRYTPSTDTWVTTSAAPGVPSPRSFHTAIWTGSRMVVWGGRTENPLTELSSGGRYDPSTDSWSPTSEGAGTPSPRRWHVAVWTGSRMIVWGGEPATNTGGRYDPVDDVWVPTSTGFGTPEARYGHTGVWAGDELIVWGGYSGSGQLNTGGRYDPVSDIWAPIHVSAGLPSARGSHAAVWTGAEMIVWGGAQRGGGRYDPATDTWARIATGPGEPPAAYEATAVWTGTEMIVWGGVAPEEPNAETNLGGRYDPAADAWSLTSAGPNVPSPRRQHFATWTNDRMLVWGGSPGAAATTGGFYDPAADTWTPTIPGAASWRDGCSVVWTGRDLIVWGGWVGQFPTNSGTQYDPASGLVRPTSTGPHLPSARSHAYAVWTGAEMIVWGGVALYGPNPWDGARLDPRTGTWATVATPPQEFMARRRASVVWTGSEMILWGGYDHDYVTTSTGGRYDPRANTWAVTSMAGAPSARYFHTAVLTDREMIVWGGNGVLADGARYCVSCARDHWSRDRDLDRFGDPADEVVSCVQPEGYVFEGGDCDDTDPLVSPAAIDECDAFDNNCDGAVDNGPLPVNVTLLRVDRPDPLTGRVTWDPLFFAFSYDVIRGDLGALLVTAGDFAAATRTCLADDTWELFLDDAAMPPAGDGFWYLVRAADWDALGPYDTGDCHEIRSREEGIQLSGVGCP